MLTTRRYFRTRRAWSPRMWPVILPSAVVAGVVAHLTGWHQWWQIAGLWVLFGAVPVQVRWMIWRWRHPRISHDQYLSDIRRAAPWN